MKTNRISVILVSFCLVLMSSAIHAQTSQVVYSADGRSGSLTLLASDCTNGYWYYEWEITVPVNTPLKITTQSFYASWLDVYTSDSGGFQIIFSDNEPDTVTTSLIATNGKIYVYSYEEVVGAPASDVFTISFEVDSTVYSPSNDLYVPGKMSVASGLDVFGTTYINNRLGIGLSSTISKVYVYNNQDNNAISLYSDKSSTSSLYGLYTSASNGIGNVYGLYSTVTGTSGKKWSGYFNGGDVAILNGNTGIGVNDPKGILQVRGTYENSWIYFSSNAGMSSTNKPKPRVNYGMAFTWNYSGGNGESIINYSRESGSSPRLDFTSYDGVNLTTEMTLKGGSLGIGVIQIPDSFKLAVAGKIIAEEVVVQLQSEWPDYVFTPDYRLLPLQKVEEFVKTHKHLPGIPSASELEEKGLSMGQMQSKLVEKIEELTLYIIEQDKKIKELESRLR